MFLSIGAIWIAVLDCKPADVPKRGLAKVGNEVPTSTQVYFHGSTDEIG